MTETVECCANEDGEVFEKQLKSDKFNKNLTDVVKQIFNLLKRPKERQSIRAYS